MFMSYQFYRSNIHKANDQNVVYTLPKKTL